MWISQHVQLLGYNSQSLFNALSAFSPAQPLAVLVVVQGLIEYIGH